MLCMTLLAACATGYGEKGFFSGGYEETQLAPTVYRVTFSGNDSTSMARAADFALLRSAELAVEYGYPLFEVLESGQWVETESVSTPMTSSSAGSVAGSGGTFAGSSASTTVGGQTLTSNKPRTSNIIKLLKTKDDAHNSIYDAKFLVESLRAKYQINPK
jgi:hypothetical protein